MNPALRDHMRDLYKLSVEIERSTKVMAKRWPSDVPFAEGVGKRLREEPELAARTVPVTLAELYHLFMTDLAAHAETVRSLELALALADQRDIRGTTYARPLEAVSTLHAEVERFLQGGRLQ